jgi:hypothetical protein
VLEELASRSGFAPSVNAEYRQFTATAATADRAEGDAKSRRAADQVVGAGGNALTSTSA